MAVILGNIVAAAGVVGLVALSIRTLRSGSSGCCSSGGGCSGNCAGCGCACGRHQT